MKSWCKCSEIQFIYCKFDVLQGVMVDNEYKSYLACSPDEITVLKSDFLRAWAHSGISNN